MENPTQRGIITDYFNNIIADNQRVYQVHLSLEEFPILIIQFLNLKILLVLKRMK